MIPSDSISSTVLFSVYAIPFSSNLCLSTLHLGQPVEYRMIFNAVQTSFEP